MFLEDYSVNRFGVSYIETSASERRRLAKMVGHSVFLECSHAHIAVLSVGRLWIT